MSSKLFGVKRTLSDELRERSATAPENKRQSELEKKRQTVEDWYERCRKAAIKAAGEGKREARVGTYIVPSRPTAEETELLNAVTEKLWTIDKLHMHTEIVESQWISDDTGEPFTKTILVLVITW